MRRVARVVLASVAAVAVIAAIDVTAQTPEQQQLWDAQKSQAIADQKVLDARLARDREVRKTDPMAWVNALDPMSSGGWEFRAVANDGSWAAYSTNHQMKRSGRSVIVWLRQEYAEPQAGANGRYSSVVEKTQYDCKKELTRELLIIFYSDNNLQGTEQTEEADLKTATWNAIVPGTRDEFNFQWACSVGKSAPRN